MIFYYFEVFSQKNGVLCYRNDQGRFRPRFWETTIFAHSRSKISKPALNRPVPVNSLGSLMWALFFKVPMMSVVSKFVSKRFRPHGMHSNSWGWCIMMDFIGTGVLHVNTDFTVSMNYSLQSNVLTLNIGTFRTAIFGDKINDTCSLLICKKSQFLLSVPKEVRVKQFYQARVLVIFSKALLHISFHYCSVLAI